MEEWTLEELLEWQREKRQEHHLVFVEIYGDGTVICKSGRGFELEVYGDTLHEALTKARRKWGY